MTAMFKKFLAPVLLAAAIAFSATSATAQSATAPKSVIHVVTVKFKPEATPAQIKAAVDGVQALPKDYKGITRVWTKAIKVQGDKTHAFIMEFADEAALTAYSNSPAQKKWYESYLPIRLESTTFDITN